MIIDLEAERQKRQLPKQRESSAPCVVEDLRAARMRRANKRLINYENDGAADDIFAARYILCARNLPGASLEQVAIMTRHSSGKPASKPKRGPANGRSSSKPRSGRKPQRRRSV